MTDAADLQPPSGAELPAGGRERVRTARRIVVKIGSSSLTSSSGAFDEARLTALVDALAMRRTAGADIVLVSSGAVAAGIAPLHLTRRPSDLATQQAAASVGQALLMHHYLVAAAKRGMAVGQVLLTTDDLVRRAHYRNARRTLNRLLALSILPVVNENDTVATEEIRFGDNDRLAALVAHLVDADLLVLLSDVDGLYATDPREVDAARIAEVRQLADLDDVRIGRARSGVGTGGMQTKLDAVRVATTTGVPVLLAAATDAAAALSGDPVGTWFHATNRRPAARHLWLAHATAARGRLLLDAGAVRAVVERRSSLLPAGITGVEGHFVAGDPVDLVDEQGATLARGMVNYDADELPSLLGRSTWELAREHGPSYEREVVHRDQMVLLTPDFAKQ